MLPFFLWPLEMSSRSDSLAELWNDELQSRKKRKDPFSPDKKKPVVVSDILSALWVSALCSALPWLCPVHGVEGAQLLRVRCGQFVQALLRQGLACSPGWP